MKYYLLLTVVLVLFLFSCEEVVQKELDKEKVTLISPVNHLKTTDAFHIFLWESVEKADGYILQIAKPSFATMKEMVLYEDLQETSFEYNFSPGAYEWRVKAYNNISETPFTTYSITIDSTLNLTNSQVILQAPADDLITNSDVLTFQWNAIDAAEEYRLEIREPDWENGTQVIYPYYTTLTSYTNSDLPFEEGTYAWSVSAENEFSKSKPSTPRSFTIDYTDPAIPVTDFPKEGNTLGDSTFSFRWIRAQDNGSEISDSLYVYRDILKTNLVRGISTSETFHTDSLGKGSYYWQVRSIDAALNKSAFSNLVSFKIQ